ncbi:hypothetical protein GCM10009096_25780 [Parasphingorhabdus litoris]|uniref:Glycosyl transferase n=1 Tax=Parasphingorhabdus litoris TaxID=394733 RepID=A0ABN1ARD4_9SPHN|nr:hypothetical protein [Parasphingorhabdus litoris]
MIFDQFDSIRIINLPYRTDRRAEMEGELARLGLLDDPRVAFFNAFQFEDAGTFSSPGARGVFQSHLAILEEAATNGHRVLILEDDCDFIPGAKDYVPPQAWSIFYGGYEASNPDNLLESDIIGAHMMGFAPETAMHLADYLKNLEYEGMHPPIDGAYIWYRRAHPDIATLFAEPALGNQRPSRTDIAELRFFDKIPIVRDFVGVARKLKRALNR